MVATVAILYALTNYCTISSFILIDIQHGEEQKATIIHKVSFLSFQKLGDSNLFHLHPAHLYWFTYFSQWERDWAQNDDVAQIGLHHS